MSLCEGRDGECCHRGFGVLVSSPFYYHIHIRGLVLTIGGYSMHSVGMRTGVDLEKVSEVGAWISEAIGRKNNSKVGPALLAKRPETPASS